MSDFLSCLTPEQLQKFRVWQATGSEPSASAPSASSTSASPSVSPPASSNSANPSPQSYEWGTTGTRFDAFGSQFPLLDQDVNSQGSLSFYTSNIQQPNPPAPTTAKPQGPNTPAGVPKPKNLSPEVSNNTNISSELLVNEDSSSSSGETDDEDLGMDLTEPADPEAVEELWEIEDRRPLIQQMGFTSYKDQKDRTEYLRQRRMARKALMQQPYPFNVNNPWRSVKNRATRELLVQKVQKSLAAYNYSHEVSLGIILSLTYNRRRNKNRVRNLNLGRNGGVVKKGRPPTHGRYCGLRRKKTPAPPLASAPPLPLPPAPAPVPAPAPAPGTSRPVAGNSLPDVIAVTHSDSEGNISGVNLVDFEIQVPPGQETSFSEMLASSDALHPDKNMFVSHDMAPVILDMSTDIGKTTTYLPSSTGGDVSSATNYNVEINKGMVEFSFQWSYERFRRAWNGEDCWYRFPGAGQSTNLLDDEHKYTRFLDMVIKSGPPVMWIHSEECFQEPDEEESLNNTDPKLKKDTSSHESRTTLMHNNIEPDSLIVQVDNGGDAVYHVTPPHTQEPRTEYDTTEHHVAKLHDVMNTSNTDNLHNNISNLHGGNDPTPGYNLADFQCNEERTPISSLPTQVWDRIHTPVTNFISHNGGYLRGHKTTPPDYMVTTGSDFPHNNGDEESQWTNSQIGYGYSQPQRAYQHIPTVEVPATQETHVIIEVPATQMPEEQVPNTQTSPNNEIPGEACPPPPAKRGPGRPRKDGMPAQPRTNKTKTPASQPRPKRKASEISDEKKRDTVKEKTEQKKMAAIKKKNAAEKK